MDIKKLSIVTISLIFISSSFLVCANAATTGSVIKSKSYTSLYYLGADGKRYVFPNDKTFFSWYSDFSTVSTVSDTELASYSLGGNVTYKPGKKLVKVTTDPKTYAVDNDGTLRWVTTENIAQSLYGTDWAKKVDDVPDEFFINYKIGSPITNISEFSPQAVITIDDDKRSSSKVSANSSQETIPKTNTTEASPSTVITITGQTVSTSTAKIEWATNQQTESKLYLSGGGLNSKLYTSETGFTTHHIVNISSLNPSMDYSYQITAIGNDGLASYSGLFKTATPSPTLTIIGGGDISLNSSGNKITWTSTYVSSCFATGDWAGEKNPSGEYAFPVVRVGKTTYGLTCQGTNGENVSKSVTVNIVDTKPKIIFSFNRSPNANTYSGSVGTVHLEWSTVPYSNNCNASGDWSGAKLGNGSVDLVIDHVGTFNYSLICTNNDGERSDLATATAIISP
jgi:hypothetical protein